MSHYDKCRPDIDKYTVMKIEADQRKREELKRTCDHPRMKIIQTMAGWLCTKCNQIVEECPFCLGTGIKIKRGDPVPCSVCNGKGVLVD